MKMLAALVLALPLATFAQQDPGLPPPPPAGWEPAPTAAPPGVPAPPLRPAKTRGSWYIGFGLGSGNGSISDDSGTHPFKDYVGADPMNLSFNFNVGATLTPSLLLGFEGGAVAALSSTEVEPGVRDTQIQTNYYDAALTYFPMERGFFVKGGLGLSTLVWDLDSAGSNSWSGYNVMGGVGYAWWLGQSFNLVASLDGTKAWYGSDGPDSTQGWSLQLGFEWY
jgi:hypothetical protein